MPNPVNDTGETGNGNTCAEVPWFKDLSNSGRWKQNEKTSNVFQNILGQNRKMIEIFRQISNVAEYDYPEIQKSSYAQFFQYWNNPSGIFSAKRHVM